MPGEIEQRPFGGRVTVVDALVASPMERERALVSALLAVQLLLWLGFAVHRAPQFPGSFNGTLLGIAGATLMVLPSLAFAAVKRSASLRRSLARRLPLRRVLAWHIWAGIVGSVLAILHTGHRFASTLGIVLTAVMLVTVFSGYIGRHILGKVSLDLRQKQRLLEQLTSAYNDLAKQIAALPERRAGVIGNGWSRLGRRFSLVRQELEPAAHALAYQATEIAGSIADLEYGIKADDVLRRRLRRWLAVHIAASVLFYGLLGLHIWSSIHFGLRWLA